MSVGKFGWNDKEKLHMKNFDNNNENCVEFLSGEKYMVVTFTNRKHINRIKKLYEERKDDFKYLIENKDGSICAKLPLKWLKINPGSQNGRVMTEEQKEAARIRLQQAREKRKENSAN